MRLSTAAANAGGLAAGYLLDRLLGDPRRFHPVAGYGQAAAALERKTYAPSRAAGAKHVAVAVAVPVAVAAVAQYATRNKPVARAAVMAIATWTVLGGTSLRREATRLADALAVGDLDEARAKLPSLCGRKPDELGPAELARATVESVAENTSDAVVAPLCWGAVAGIPGLVGYRAVNTLDAMIGHRSARYEKFGWAAARLDDLANLVPARLGAVLTVLVAGKGRRGAALRTWLRDGSEHPSPNSGQVEAAAAGALGLRLGGRNDYGSRVEVRPHLGDGAPPAGRDIYRAARLSAAVGVAALVATAGHALAAPVRRAAVAWMWRRG
uniref:cobalamin biosynthesis protein n=1 Tax=Longispora albida TaxID=203523 RepID=UPI000372666D